MTCRNVCFHWWLAFFVLGTSAIGQEVTPESVTRFTFAGAPPAWFVFLILAPALLAFVWVTYRYSPVERPRLRMLLAGLRTTALAIMLFLIFGPQFEKVFLLEEKRSVAIVVDRSLSMDNQDAYADSTLRRRVEKALDEAGRPGSASDLSRFDIATRLLWNPVLDQLDEEYDVHVLPFADDISILPLAAARQRVMDERAETPGAPQANDVLDARGRNTDLTLPIERVLATWDNEELQDLFLLTDGRHNTNIDPLPAALEASAEGLRVYPVIVGDPAPSRNLVLEFATTPPDVVLEEDLVMLDMQVRTVGYPFGAAAPNVGLQLSVHRIDGEDREELRPTREESFATDVALSAIGRDDGSLNAAEYTGAGRLSFKPMHQGIYRVDVRAEALPDERRETDNQVSTVVIVRDATVRVLYIEGGPRYEYRFLSSILLRGDRKIIMQGWLASAASTFPQLATILPASVTPNRRVRELPSLESLPLDLDRLDDWCPQCMDIQDVASGSGQRAKCPRHGCELEPRYHVVILGDIEPQEISEDVEQRKRFLAGLERFVMDGGGLLVLAGEIAMPRLYGGTDLEKLLPVRLLTDGRDRQPSSEEGFRPLLEMPSMRAGDDPATERQPHEICRLLADPVENRQLFESPGKGLPALLWYYRVGDLRIGAEALLRHPYNTREGAPNDRNDRRNLDILAAVHDIGRDGRVMWMGTDETWRWRFQYEDIHMERFYRNAVRWLALNRLLHPTRSVRVRTDEPEYRAGDSANITIEVEEGFDAIAKDDTRVQAYFQKLPPEGSTWASPFQALRVGQLRGESVRAANDGRSTRFQSYRATLPELDEPGNYRVFVTRRDDGERGLPLAFANFRVTVSQRETEEVQPNPELLSLMAQRAGGKLLEPDEFGDQLRQLVGNGTITRETGRETPEPIWDSWWALVLVLVILSLEWIIRKWVQLI